MFKNLTKLEFNRTGLQALGFYLAYLLLLILSGGLIGGMVAGIFANDADEAYQMGLKLGNIMAVLYCITITILVLKKKKLLNNFAYILLVLLSGLLSILLGGLGGLIPVAYLTTKKAEIEKK